MIASQPALSPIAVSNRPPLAPLGKATKGQHAIGSGLSKPPKMWLQAVSQVKSSRNLKKNEKNKVTAK